MGKISLLDCTVRDGGYLNDWNYSQSVLVETVQRLINAGIEYVEVGFLDDRRPFDINRSIFPNTKCIKDIYGAIDKKNTKLVAMIDYGTCDISNLQKREETMIDGIRVIFKKEKMFKAIPFCKQVKDLGYEVFTQLVSTTVYEEKDYDNIASLVNELMPHALSIVDTYGVMDNKELDYIYNQLDSRLDKRISLGFHAHNNVQLGYSNAISFIEKNTAEGRDLLADGTLHGMGKGAGNAPIETLAFYCNKYYGTHYDINQLLEAIDSNILILFGKNNWGYSMKFFLASTNRVHPNYLSDYISSSYLSVSNINDALKGIEEEKKLYYDKGESARALELIKDRIASKSNEDMAKIAKNINGKPVLLLGPGETLTGERNRIEKYIKDNNPVVISVNFIPNDFKVDYIFVTNSRRLCSISSNPKSNSVEMIATSNLSPITKDFDYVVDYLSLIDNSAARDSAIVMSLRMLSRFDSPKSVALAGFDGYKSFFEENFVSISSSYGWKEPYPGFLNSYIRGEIENLSHKMDIKFVTTSMFEEED